MLHKSAKGRIINFDEMVHKNSKTIAVGSANLNARGDIIGPGGKVVQTAEDRDLNNSATVSTTKASIQSEISSLKAARNQWTEQATQPALESEITEVVTEETVVSNQPETSEPTKKIRKITESE